MHGFFMTPLTVGGLEGFGGGPSGCLADALGTSCQRACWEVCSNENGTLNRNNDIKCKTSTNNSSLYTFAEQCI